MLSRGWNTCYTLSEAHVIWWLKHMLSHGWTHVISLLKHMLYSKWNTCHLVVKTHTISWLKHMLSRGWNKGYPVSETHVILLLKSIVFYGWNPWYPVAETHIILQVKHVCRIISHHLPPLVQILSYNNWLLRMIKICAIWPIGLFWWWDGVLEDLLEDFINNNN